ncbi:MAG TPA: type II secretion system protein [Chthonomonadaceae bacterium]|nr:type II secretion system protein [Chthonomonadaceae bacterium]
MSKTKRTTSLQSARRAFTLVELLVVLAITAILLTLIFKPLIDGFNLTSRSNAQIQSQTLARDVTRLISTALSDAVFIFDNSQQASLLNLWFTDKSGAEYLIPSQYTMMEYVAPARQLDQNPGNVPIDPTTGLPIYPSGQGSFALPLAPGRALGRIWIGLTDNRSGPPAFSGPNGTPINPYTNRFEDPRAATQDNRYTLYRAEVLPYIQDPDNPGTYIPNLKLFHAPDANNQDSKTGTLQIHDPNFFYDNSLAGDANSKGARKWAVPGWQDLAGDGKVHIWENWRAIATSMLNVNRVDMVALDRDENNNIIYDPNTLNPNDNQPIPTVRPLALFSPSYVDNDAGTASSLGDAGNETPFAASPTYTSQYGHWSGDPVLIPYHVFVYRSSNPNQDPLTMNPLSYFETFGDGRIVNPQNATLGENAPTYQQYIGAQPYNGQTLTDVGPQTRPDGTWANTTPAFAFTVDPERGQIKFSFPAAVLVHDAKDSPLPSVYSPADINAGMTGTYNSRYLDLHVLPATATAAPWTGTPLNPASALSPLGQLDSTPLSGNVHITPGTEQVFGPDQRWGPHYGYRIQYSRVPDTVDSTRIGPNEYKINYDDNPNPVGTNILTRIGCIVFDSQPEANLTQDDPAKGNYFTNALPTYKVDPNTGQDVLADPVEVYYNFQMNRQNDVVKMDYLTRELMNIKLEIHFYDPASSRPQITVLTTKVQVGNFQR